MNNIFFNNYIQYLNRNGHIKTKSVVFVNDGARTTFQVKAIPEDYFILAVFQNNVKISGIGFDNFDNIDMLAFINSNFFDITTVPQNAFLTPEKVAILSYDNQQYSRTFQLDTFFSSKPKSANVSLNTAGFTVTFDSLGVNFLTSSVYVNYKDTVESFENHIEDFYNPDALILGKYRVLRYGRYTFVFPPSVPFSFFHDYVSNNYILTNREQNPNSEWYWDFTIATYSSSFHGLDCFNVSKYVYSYNEELNTTVVEYGEPEGSEFFYVGFDLPANFDFSHIL